MLYNGIILYTHTNYGTLTLLLELWAHKRRAYSIGAYAEQDHTLLKMLGYIMQEAVLSSTTEGTEKTEQI